MATLSIQLRLGLSRGWRVRSLIKAKFYAQSVVHCLFIFSVLRARGFTERIWTLNYSVFMSSDKYAIFIEYFKLPNHIHWLRPSRRDSIYRFVCVANRLDRRYAGVEALYVTTPNAAIARNAKRFCKKNAKYYEQGEKIFWAWERRQLLLNFYVTRNSLVWSTKNTGKLSKVSVYQYRANTNYM